MKDYIYGVAACSYAAGMCFAFTCAVSLWCWIPMVAAGLGAALFLYLGLTQADADRIKRDSIEYTIDALREERDALRLELQLRDAIRKDGLPTPAGLSHAARDGGVRETHVRKGNP